jgi:hypothetical protein
MRYGDLQRRYGASGLAQPGPPETRILYDEMVTQLGKGAMHC